MTDELNETLHAFTETDAGATIRLRGYETEGGWIEAVEVVDGTPDEDDAHVTTLYEGQGMKPTTIYNQTVDAFLDAEGNPLVDASGEVA